MVGPACYKKRSHRSGKESVTAHATAEWVETGKGRLPLLVLTHEDEIECVGPVWMARSILTGHVAAGITEARARKCLRLTVQRSIEIVLGAGCSHSDWLHGQKPAEPEYLRQYFTEAAEAGERVDWSRHGGTTIAIAPS